MVGQKDFVGGQLGQTFPAQKDYRIFRAFVSLFKVKVRVKTKLNSVLTQSVKEGRRRWMLLKISSQKRFLTRNWVVFKTTVTSPSITMNTCNWEMPKNTRNTRGNNVVWSKNTWLWQRWTRTRNMTNQGVLFRCSKAFLCRCSKPENKKVRFSKLHLASRLGSF